MQQLFEGPYTVSIHFSLVLLQPYRGMIGLVMKTDMYITFQRHNMIYETVHHDHVGVVTSPYKLPQSPAYALVIKMRTQAE